MADRVYIETTIVSYLTAWPSRDVVIAGHQQTTREWWDTARSQFDIYTSQLVVEEASGGDPVAAKERLDVLKLVPIVATTPQAVQLANELVTKGALPKKADSDAL